MPTLLLAAPAAPLLLADCAESLIDADYRSIERQIKRYQLRLRAERINVIVSGPVIAPPAAISLPELLWFYFGIRANISGDRYTRNNVRYSVSNVPNAVLVEAASQGVLARYFVRSKADAERFRTAMWCASHEAYGRDHERVIPSRRNEVKRQQANRQRFLAGVQSW